MNDEEFEKTNMLDMTDSDIGFLTILLYPEKNFGSTGATNNAYRWERYDTTEVKL